METAQKSMLKLIMGLGLFIGLSYLLLSLLGSLGLILVLILILAGMILAGSYLPAPRPSKRISSNPSNPGSFKPNWNSQGSAQNPRGSKYLDELFELF